MANVRYLLPDRDALVKLILWDPAVRALVCGYKLQDDVLIYFTAADLRKLREITFIDTWEAEPVLRKWKFRDWWVYGIWGYPEMIAATMRKLAAQKRLSLKTLVLPAEERENQVMYIVGARRRFGGAE